jgi:phage terminase large subunit-like protein
MAFDYTGRLTSGKLVAGQLSIKAADRFLRDYARQNTADFPYRLDVDSADRVCRFISQCQHVKGPLGGQCIKLEPWQCFILVNVFGWLHTEGVPKEKRRYRKAYIEVGQAMRKVCCRVRWHYTC